MSPISHFHTKEWGVGKEREGVLLITTIKKQRPLERYNPYICIYMYIYTYVYVKVKCTKFKKPDFKSLVR